MSVIDDGGLWGTCADGGHIPAELQPFELNELETRRGQYSAQGLVELRRPQPVGQIGLAGEGGGHASSEAAGGRWHQHDRTAGGRQLGRGLARLGRSKRQE